MTSLTFVASSPAADSARLAVIRSRVPEPQRLLRVWKRVLERRLRGRLRAEVTVEVHDNTHTMVTFERVRRGWRIRVHHMFLAAPEEVVTALAEFVRSADARSSAVLDRFIERTLLEDDPARRKSIGLVFDYAQYLVPAGDLGTLGRSQGTNLQRSQSA